MGEPSSGPWLWSGFATGGVVRGFVYVCDSEPADSYVPAILNAH